MKFTLLVIDDEKNIREGLAADFEMDGYDVKIAANGDEGLEFLSKGDIDLVITDLRMPGTSGEDVLKKVTREMPGIPVIVLTGHGSIDAAVSAMQNGAYDFLTKPLNLEHLELVVKRALKGRELSLQHQELLSEVKSKSSDNMIGKSPSLQKVNNLINKVADSKISILITGESGVGKEVVADAIQQKSSRRDKPFIKVHCAALSESLLESELFGHEKGAFTGAETLHKGKFELADGGTIFLDEIGEINPGVQVKLLRVLQEKKFERVGGEKTIEVDVRVISATNKTLEDEVKQKHFREDLYFRLKGIEIMVPPLRERKDDIPLLLNNFLLKYNKENNKNIKGFSNSAKNILFNYDWPGNVRELQHCVESAVVMASGDEIQAEDLTIKLEDKKNSSGILVPYGISLEDAEKMIILENLESNNGNKTKTADILKIGRKTLHRKLNEYGLVTSSGPEEE
ncbi:MAG: sigma-54 dependent transcriptional regulator [Spirochaetales bacterium]|mgnify:FL=1|uniref:DNA-binding transcriptional response regulator, NtrC family, contains REC, AAA-type ATPase, and a Fis-type DNA-binding domains n=1 Tax=Treponema berlinense TaxID=225004 RepID=A0A1T4LM17_9SPIR|nr:sigma-54 dependent transcriptional regulator [Treponema berlinense]MDO5767546.1 sigma-54 dependent transcriptional regulator [Spirochaetales bacterium]MCI5540669.1 sigma-54 dependent transcriptional regulator [Treponema berlinense]MDD5834259.1 sigma-54 dependent transcriptional regulator [Treponema berlinense]MDY3708246.1 sigma-54 dependent transcriptional regulator [Treponema berlinense]SJZ55484.1 DNA-binding transcriptional response regulator, NtrC family, contains REC, AAA-type ATPase, a